MGFPLDQYRRDIHSRGREAVLVREANLPTDPGSPWSGSTAASAEKRQTVIMKFKPISFSDVDGDRVLGTDQIVQIYPPDLTIGQPAVGDQIEDAGDVLTIKAVTKKKQGDTTFRYDLHVGR